MVGKLYEHTGRECIVLTGSSGCLGHSTLRLLISRDDSVSEIRCLDLVDPVESMRKSIDGEQERSRATLGYNKRIKFIKGDIRDTNVVDQIVEGADCIIHCAAKVDVWIENNDQDIGELESINVRGTENLLKAAIKFGVARFVHVSSFESFVGVHENYNAIENGITLTDSLLFGASGTTKRDADNLVLKYAGTRLAKPNSGSLKAVVIKSAFIYGEYDKYFVSKLMEVAKLFNGTLQRYTNLWIKHQPIYVANAAWALVRAKQQMDVDESISGEVFFISDDTPVRDPFDFLEPLLKVKGMTVTKSARSGLITFLFLVIFFWFKRLAARLDIFGLFCIANKSSEEKKWHQVVTPQMFLYMINTLYLNRNKASLRLRYEPLFDAHKSMKRSIEWYRDHLLI